MNNESRNIPAVELRGVSKRFGPRIILDAIDLRIARGEALVLVGPSGSGKSTLLKIISGIETPDSGQVWLAGEECTQVPPYRRKVHTVFQNYALFPHLDVSANVGFPLAVAGVRKSERERLVQTALEWVKLQSHARRPIEKLSGGERQRVALARALVDSPQCVLLDEPLSALDPHLRAETLELLQSIQARLQMTFLFITHDREEALRLGHRIGVLNQGRLEQVGSPEEIYQRPATAFVASFMGKMNWLRGHIADQGGNRQLSIGGQRLPIPLSDSPACGEATIGVRPESLRVAADGWLPARVTGRSYLGDCIVLHVQLADGTKLIVDQRAPFCEAAPGSEVRLAWPSEATHVFPIGNSEGPH